MKSIHFDSLPLAAKTVISSYDCNNIFSSTVHRVIVQWRTSEHNDWQECQLHFVKDDLEYVYTTMDHTIVRGWPSPEQRREFARVGEQFDTTFNEEVVESGTFAFYHELLETFPAERKVTKKLHRYRYEDEEDIGVHCPGDWVDVDEEEDWVSVNEPRQQWGAAIADNIIEGGERTIRITGQPQWVAMDFAAEPDRTAVQQRHGDGAETITNFESYNRVVAAEELQRAAAEPDGEDWSQRVQRNATSYQSLLDERRNDIAQLTLREFWNHLYDLRRLDLETYNETEEQRHWCLLYLTNIYQGNLREARYVYHLIPCLVMDESDFDVYVEIMNERRPAPGESIDEKIACTRRVIQFYRYERNRDESP